MAAYPTTYRVCSNFVQLRFCNKAAYLASGGAPSLRFTSLIAAPKVNTDAALLLNPEETITGTKNKIW